MPEHVGSHTLKSTQDQNLHTMLCLNNSNQLDSFKQSMLSSYLDSHVFPHLNQHTWEELNSSISEGRLPFIYHPNVFPIGQESSQCGCPPAHYKNQQTTSWREVALCPLLLYPILKTGW